MATTLDKIKDVFKGNINTERVEEDNVEKREFARPNQYDNW